MSEQGTAFKYFAFISYSRKDSKVAAWLQKRLEWFRFPVKLVPEDHRPPHDRYVRPIYRDKTNLEVSDEHYWKNIKEAIGASRYLIILCSPHSAQSGPVELEVSHFLATHGGEASLLAPVILGGSVTSAGEYAALCPSLRGLGDTLTTRNLPTMVPDAVTAEDDAREHGFVSLVSYLLRLERTAIGDHIQRESRRQAAVLRRWLAAVVVLSLIAIGSFIFARRQLIETTRHLERSQLEEGRAWLERAKAAENRHDHLSALMLAGRAVGYQGYGRQPPEPPDVATPFLQYLLESLVGRDVGQEVPNFNKQFPLLVAKPMTFPTTEGERLRELEDVTPFIRSVQPTTLPLWASAAESEFTCVAFSPDGNRLASGSRDKTIKVWDVATGKEVATLAGHTRDVTGVAFSPDGSRLASGSRDETIKLWDAAGGKELATFTGIRFPVTSVTFSPDGSRLASGSWDWDKPVKIWDVASGKEVATLGGHISTVTSVSFSPDGSRLASGSEDETIKVWDVADGKEVATLAGHISTVTSVAFSPDGSRLASGSWDDTIKLWDVASGKEVATLAGHWLQVASVAFSPDGSRLASGSWDETIKLWDLASGKEVASLDRPSLHQVLGVAFSPDGSRLASVSRNKTTRVWDVAAGKELVPLSGHTREVTSVAFSPDGSRLASGSEDETITVWDAASGKELATLAGHRYKVTSVAFSPDGRLLAGGSFDGVIKVWDVTTGKEVSHLSWDTREIRSMAFSPDGRCLASGSHDKTIKVWDVATGKEVATLAGHTSYLTSVAFNPDGSRLASGSEDKTIKLWDVAGGKEVATFTGIRFPVRSVAFSPDGHRLASRSGDWDQPIKVWDVESGSEVSMQADGLASAQEWLAVQEHRLCQQRVAEMDGNRVFIRPAKAELDLTAPLRAGLLALPGRELEFPEIKWTTPMFHIRQDTLAQLADPRLTLERRAELRMVLCTKSRQFRAATAQWERLLQGEWPGFEGTTVPKDQAPATIPADSPIRRLYLLALIDATKHPQIHGHPTICQTAAQITPVLTKEMMATPTISLAMMSLMQTLARDDHADMADPRTALMKKLEELAAKEWLAVLRGTTGT